MALKKILVDGKEFKYKASFEKDDVLIEFKDELFRFNRNDLEGMIFTKGNLKHLFTEESSLLLNELSFSDNAQVIRNESAAPMPGKIIQVLKEDGKKVKTGDVILKMEAMKMEHEIKAYKDGVLDTLFVQVGDQVSSAQALFEIK